MLGQEAVGIAQIAKETGLTRQTVYRIKGDPAGAEGALGVWGFGGCERHVCDRGSCSLLRLDWQRVTLGAGRLSARNASTLSAWYVGSKS